MKISIAERLKPFSHAPGASTLLPGLGWPLQIFPCLIRIYRFQKVLPLQLTELNLALNGPVEQFTITNDLEKGRLTVSGMTRDGWMRYHLIASQDQKGIRLVVDRAPSGGLHILEENKQAVLQNHEWLDIFERSSSFEPYLIPPCDRLSLGCNKAQEWEMIRRRESLEEIFPLWHRMGQLIPQNRPPVESSGTLALLEECRRHFSYGRPEAAEQCWRNLFLCAFGGMLVPQLEDSHYQGIIEAKPFEELDASPLLILSEGARLIRQLLIHQEEGSLSVLPFLLPCLPFGRLIDVPLTGGGSVSLEWSKKTIRQMIIHSEQENEIDLKFRSNISSYRLRQHTRDKGERIPRSSTLSLKKNCQYLIDNFN